jgi:hypothetical protein
MTNKEISEIGRQCLNVRDYDRLHQLFDELDPPYPEPGAVVWYRRTDADPWILAIVEEGGEGIVFDDRSYLPWFNVYEWKLARILADDEVAVQVPDISGWPDDSECVEVALIYDRHTHLKYAQHVITRAEAEAREAE